jgi:acetyl-CoA C-acetyltransferase
MNEVYIVSLARTPIGSFNGSLATLSATQLGAISIKSAISKAKIEPNEVTEVFMGNVLSAGLGQAPARQAAIFAGLLENTICTTVNKVCASGMKAIMLGAQSIQLGINELVVCGGMESMSNVPHYMEKSRAGYKLGNVQMTDGIIKDGLWDVYNNYHMGSAAEKLAAEMKITREQQDEFAIQSYKKSALAWQNQQFQSEIAPVEIQQKDKTITISEDEEYKNVNFDKIRTLKPVFQKDGTITAANASTLNDGAVALVLMSSEKVKKMNIKPLARIVSFADAAQAPEKFTTSPSLAIPKALKNADLNINQIDYFEINEAFSVVSIANNQLLNLNPEKVNLYGGAVSLGHPLGMSGARIVGTLCQILAHQKAKYGVAGICNGGGGASAMVIENL